MKWSPIPILLSVLVSGCVTNSGSYCDIASPIYLGGEATVTWLSENDDRLLRDIVVTNETWSTLCTGAPSL